MTLTFVEARGFSVRWHNRLDDDALRALQNELMEDPNGGDPVPGCGVLRKIRFGDAGRGKGKRGGVRVIYVYTPEAQQIDLVAVYGKDEADDLTKHDLRILCGYARLLRQEASSRAGRLGAKRKGQRG